MKFNKLLFKKTEVSWALLIFLVLLCNLNVFAQSITVTGVVTAESDTMPVPGATVLVKGTTTGAVTDFDGLFEIKVNLSKDSSLTFFSTEFISKSIPITKKSKFLKVELKEDLDALDEIVVGGIGHCSRFGYPSLKSKKPASRRERQKRH